MILRLLEATEEVKEARKVDHREVMGVKFRIMRKLGDNNLLMIVILLNKECSSKDLADRTELTNSGIMNPGLYLENATCMHNASVNKERAYQWIRVIHRDDIIILIISYIHGEDNVW